MQLGSFFMNLSTQRSYAAKIYFAALIANTPDCCGDERAICGAFCEMQGEVA